MAGKMKVKFCVWSLFLVIVTFEAALGQQLGRDGNITHYLRCKRTLVKNVMNDSMTFLHLH